ncbi:MAG: cysteine--tRNA ligase [Phycisphaerae bacterium]
MAIHVYNTLTGHKETFEPVDPPKVGIYLCGPTVYKPSHIGHAVGPIIFDAIKRYLTFRGYEVTWVVNVTDVEDKIIVEARQQGCTCSELAERIAAEYLASMDQLDITGIDQMPKASEHIGNIIAFIQRLIDQGAAYSSEGDVYFDVTADGDYGKLSNRAVDTQEGQRELAGGHKRHPGDFALWKAAKADEPDEVKFDSPWGPGRPGWHIECSVMSMQVLGETFDIHGGGLDLIFPHHENEIAQSETATGKPFAKYWLHNGLTRFNTKKVSKSDPQMQKALTEMTLSNLLGRYPGELLRFFILSTHYRRPIEYSPAEIESKRKGLTTFHRLFERLERATKQCPYQDGPTLDSLGGSTEFDCEVREHQARFERAMDDDFNTAAAIGVMFELANAVNRFIERERIESDSGGALGSVALAAGRQLVALGRLLGLFLKPPAGVGGADTDLAEKAVQVAIEIRRSAKSDKRFGVADAIRDKLSAAGVTLEDRGRETTWRADGAGDALDGVVQSLIDVRTTAKKDKDFATADAIRDQLAQAGITLEDRPDGTVWRSS